MCYAREWPSVGALSVGWSGFIHHFKDVALELMPKWCGGSFHVTVWEKNFVSQEEIQRQDRQDGVSETGFTLPLEITTLQIHKCVWNNSFSRHWTSDSEVHWSVRNGKQDESSDYLCVLAWESLRATVQEMGSPGEAQWTLSVEETLLRVWGDWGSRSL